MNQAAPINTDFSALSEGQLSGALRWSAPRVEPVVPRAFPLSEAARILGVRLRKLVKWLCDAFWLRLVKGAVEPVYGRVAEGWMVVTESAGICLTVAGMAKLARFIQPDRREPSVRLDRPSQVGAGFYVARKLEWGASSPYVVVRFMPTDFHGTRVYMVHEAGNPKPSFPVEWQFRDKVAGLDAAGAEYAAVAQARADAIGTADFMDEIRLFPGR